MKKYFLMITGPLLLALLACNSGGGKNEKNNAGPTIKFSDTVMTKLVNSQVCMVNNRFLNSNQIAVPQNGKTYYGCCEGCVKMLNEDSTTHFTYDLLSGEQVDKAIAFIIGKPGTYEEVLYFKSETNARGYFNRYQKQNHTLK